MFQTYLTLLGATITAIAKDSTLQQYLGVSRDLQVRAFERMPRLLCLKTGSGQKGKGAASLL